MKMPSKSLGKEALSRFDDVIQKEWITTNGLGGYASSTILGINTRKYHGLLVAALHPPGDRWVCLAKLDEEVAVGNSVYPLGANEFQNGIFPQGYGFLREFSVSPFPKYVFVAQNVEVQKTIFMPRERNVVVVLYKVLNMSGVDVKLRVFPMLAWRHFHLVTDRWKVAVDPIQKPEQSQVCISFDGTKSALMIGAIGGQYFPSGKWFESVYYREEARRGESCQDDCYQSGFFEFETKANRNESFAVNAVADENEDAARRIMAEMPATLYDMAALYEREKARHEDCLTKFYSTHVGIPTSDWLSALILATDAFIVKGLDAAQRSVIAGYHWFEEWGRDTFISLPGLMLVTGRFEDARKAFLGYKKLCKQGLIPNFIPDLPEQPVYNSVDATLWFLNAVLQYLKYTGDFKFVQEQLWQALKDIVENHIKGAVFNIHVDVDGLLSHGGQLTWMDATVDGQPNTSRAGKAVEVQALWYNALKTMELLANRFQEKDEEEKYVNMADMASKSFAERFWNEEKNCLFDVVSEHERDGSLRPNQIIAVALNFSVLDNVKGEKVVDFVHRELLTPFGLRTLAKSDSRYVGVYAGDRRGRDKAYHNGTVWPWLLGPFTTAFLKTKGSSEFRRDYSMKIFLSPLFSKQVFDAGLGTIGEIFDGDSPHAPRGCIAQAWSVAEPLRAYVEDVLQIRPKNEREVLQDLR
jgi:predicted glycogen debranching enzyme